MGIDSSSGEPKSMWTAVLGGVLGAVGGFVAFPLALGICETLTGFTPGGPPQGYFGVSVLSTLGGAVVGFSGSRKVGAFKAAGWASLIAALISVAGFSVAWLAWLSRR